MSTHAVPVNVALVDATGSISPTDLQQVAGALTEQLQADFAPVWHVRAAVTAQTQPAPHQWYIRIQRQLDEPGALGYHTDSNNVPYSLVMLTADWPATVSHELLEMLADPWGNRMHAARLPQGVDPGQVGLQRVSQRVHYLLEVCDPPERTSYEVGGVALSDFLLPAWYRTNPLPLPSYSHAGGCTAERQVANGGYVSFADDHGEWFQVFNEGGALTVQDIGRFDRAEFGSVRAFTDHHARRHRDEG